MLRTSCPRTLSWRQCAQAMEDDESPPRVLRSLDPQELAVATVYRRYGGSVNGEVIRLDLMARGLLQDHRKSGLRLLHVKAMEAQPDHGLWRTSGSCSRSEITWLIIIPMLTAKDRTSRFERYSLHAGIAQHGRARRSAPLVDHSCQEHSADDHQTLTGRGGPRSVPGFQLHSGTRLSQGPEGWLPRHSHRSSHGEGRAPGR